MYMYTCMHAHVYMYIHVHVYMYMYTCIYMYMYACIHVHVYMYIHVYMYTSRAINNNSTPTYEHMYTAFDHFTSHASSLLI